MAKIVCPSSTVSPPSHRLSLGYVHIQSVRQEVSLNCENRWGKIGKRETKEMRTRPGIGE